MARVATTFVVHNLNMDSELIRRNIWSVTEHFENPQSTGFGGKKVIDEESKIIDSSSAMVAFDVSEEEAYAGVSCTTSEFSDGQVAQLQPLVTEAATVQMKGKIFSDPLFNTSKIQTCARRLNIKYDVNAGAVCLTGTWQAIGEFRKILKGEIMNYLAAYKSNCVAKLPGDLVEKPEASPSHNSAKGIINMSSLSSDVLALMKKCGVYQNDHLTYDIEGGGVTIECPGDDEAATTIAEEFQTQYRQLMMGGKLKEHSFPIPSTYNKQQVDELVSQCNNDYSHSIFKLDSENSAIKCLSMSTRKIGHIKSKIKEMLQQSTTAHSTVGAIGADTPTSMSLLLTGGRRITLKQADITEEMVDVIVNAANDRLSHIGGVAFAINEASNGIVQQQSTAVIQQHGLIQVSQVVHTGAGGSLKCKYVIHTVGPEQYKHKDKCQELLWMACVNTLALAEKLGVTSIAIPPISSGIFGVPKDVVAKTIISAVCQYPCHPGGLLTDVRIVIIDDPTFEAFKPTFIDARANTTVITQSQDSAPPHTPPTTSFQHSHSWPNETQGDRSSRHTHSKPRTEECPICKDDITDLVTTKCKHNYCRGCLEKSLQTSPYCPVCKVPLRQVTGDQPDGRMTHQILKDQHLSGYEQYGTIKITYYIPNGIQGPTHPRPGRQFTGDSRNAYLPDSLEGREVFELLKKAFDAKMIFTIGTSATTGKANRIVWNDIHHKTNMHGGSDCYGYPDPTYLQRVKEELRQKGIV
ncbi:uncharacterized protein [Dysidea avara]|uniref:uncharacterized protein isoform X2 n=1 Tax=Dysidea avara TaxID=196820 RepID=UPI00332AAF85